MTAGDAREAGQDRDAVRMDVGEFLAGWKEDPVALLGRLRGRRAELTGRLLAVDSAGGVVTAEIGAGPGHVFGEYVVVLFDGALRRELGGHPVGSTLTVQAVFGAPDRVPRGRAVKDVKAAPK